jgi:hypothetical protein
MDTPKMRLANLRHELARWIWQARKQPIDTLEAVEYICDLTALCQDEIRDWANKLMHDMKNQLAKLHCKAELNNRGYNINFRVNALKTRKYIK